MDGGGVEIPQAGRVYISVDIGIPCAGLVGSVYELPAPGARIPRTNQPEARFLSVVLVNRVHIDRSGLFRGCVAGVVGRQHLHVRGEPLVSPSGANRGEQNYPKALS
jgi:hypothetical protein